MRELWFVFCEKGCGPVGLEGTPGQVPIFAIIFNIFRLPKIMTGSSSAASEYRSGIDQRFPRLAAKVLSLMITKYRSGEMDQFIQPRSPSFG